MVEEIDVVGLEDSIRVASERDPEWYFAHKFHRVELFIRGNKLALVELLLVRETLDEPASIEDVVLADVRQSVVELERVETHGITTLTTLVIGREVEVADPFLEVGFERLDDGVLDLSRHGVDRLVGFGE